MGGGESVVEALVRFQGSRQRINGANTRVLEAHLVPEERHGASLGWHKHQGVPSNDGRRDGHAAGGRQPVLKKTSGRQTSVESLKE